jgi:hypothetical protein
VKGLAVDVNDGLRVHVTPRLSISPQARFIQSDASRDIGLAPEPPLWLFRGEVAVGYRW